MILLLLTALSYFYFHWRYFMLAKELNKPPRPRWWLIILFFVINYLFFVTCSLMEYPLIANWFVFALLLFVETLLFNGRDFRCALFCTLLGIIGGLAINIFCRSAIAILVNQPLQSFDNHISSTGNLKGIPVLLGFLLAGLAMQILIRPHSMERIRLIANHPQHQTVLLELMAGAFFYLFLNLLLYSTPMNSLLLKIWSIKSCLFCLIGFYIALQYAWRICELSDYRERNQHIKQELEQRQKEENQLRQQVICDALTGLYNRQYAEEVILSLMEDKVGFTLCFIDLDGLKKVNDQYGHEEGDRYILTVTEQISRACRREKDLLFRVGGDEFLALFVGMSVETAVKRVEQINNKLIGKAVDNQFSFPMSFSFGAVDSREFSEVETLLYQADAKMYEQKSKKRKARDA